MGKDAKIVQRGMNVQQNDLAVPDGTPTHAVNVDYSREGIAATRAGYDAFWDGLPWFNFNDHDAPFSNPIFELFSKDRVFTQNNGFLWCYDDLANTGSKYWRTVPINLPHRVRFHGSSVMKNTSPFASTCYSSIGLKPFQTASRPGSAFRFQGPGLLNQSNSPSPPNIGSITTGAITNDASQASLTSAGAQPKYRTAFDIAPVGFDPNKAIVSDDTTLRLLVDGSVVAGSITQSGYVDGGFASPLSTRLSGASWICGSATGGTIVYFVDNSNAIRSFTYPSGLTVSTVAGSITAGSVDGVGTAARFNNISGLCYDYQHAFLYACELGGNRIRKIDPSTGSVTTFAGSLTNSTPGFTDGNGFDARFNSPIGIEYYNNVLYVGDSGNSRIRAISIATATVAPFGVFSASVTTFAGAGGASTSGMVGGPWTSCFLPSVTVRGIYVSQNSSTLFPTPVAAYVVTECAAPNNSIDIGLCFIKKSTATSVTDSPTEVISEFIPSRDQAYHLWRCPSVTANSTNGPNKFDTVGPDQFSLANISAIDSSSGCLFSTTEYPVSIDSYTRLNSTNPMPRLRSVGIDWPEAPSCTATASGTTFPASTSWAYRTLCALNLTDGRKIFGPPSERIVVTNSATVTVDASITAYPAPGLPYDGMPFVQIYRTASVTSSLDPGDQMFLCYEASLTYGQGVSFTDTLPDALLGAELYTNATQQGSAAASLRPPLWANSLSLFDGRLAVGNYCNRANVTMKLLGVSSLVVGTSNLNITTGGYGVTITAASTTSPVDLKFAVVTSGSAATNVVATARNISYCINRSPDCYMIRSWYDENNPGTIIVYSMANPTSATDITNDGTSTQDQVTIAISTNAASSFVLSSTNNSKRKSNSVAWSDKGDQDSFPAVNETKIGPSTESIQRLLPIQDVLLGVKDDSVWRGNTSFDFEQYSNSLSCILPNSFARLADEWIGLFTRGFVSLSSTQPTEIGNLINRDVIGRYNSGDIMLPSLTNFASAAANDLPGVYICRFNGKTHMYSARAGTWSIFEFPILASVTQPAWWGSFRNSFVTNIAGYPRALLKARDMRFGSSSDLSNQFYRDYAEIGYTFGSASVAIDGVTITCTIPTDLVVAGAAPSPTAMIGAVYSRSGTEATVIGFVGTSSATLTAAVPIAALGTVTSLGSITVYAPVRMALQYAPALSPGTNNIFGDVLVTMERVRSGSLTANFYNRRDLGIASGQEFPTGVFLAGQGFTRTNVMPSLSSSENQIAYYDIQRFCTPVERSHDQQLVVELVSQAAFQPLAIKSTVIDILSTDSTKVKQ